MTMSGQISPNPNFDTLEILDDQYNNIVFKNSGGLSINGTLTDNGTLINMGTLTNYGTFNNKSDGIIEGTGKIIGDTNSYGTISIGQSAGGHLINGHLYHHEGSRKVKGLGGTYHGDSDRNATEHDWIEITGDLELAGELDASLIDGFSFAESDRISVGDGVELFLTQAGDDLLLTADGIHTTFLDIDKDEFLAADVIDFI